MQMDTMALGVAVAVDASAVALACGLTWRGQPWWRGAGFVLAGTVSQMLMPAVGYAVAAAAWQAMHDILRVVAVVVLAYLAWRMVLASREELTNADNYSWHFIILAAWATSVDAAGVGVAVPGTGAALGPTVLACGAATLCGTLVALGIGRRLSAVAGRQMHRCTQLAGAGILGCIAVRLALG